MDKTQPAPVSKTLFALAAMLAGGLLLAQLSSPAAIAAQPATSLSNPTMHEGVDWSRVPAAPVSPGATVGAYDR
jgi:hypothetical protein